MTTPQLPAQSPVRPAKRTFDAVGATRPTAEAGPPATPVPAAGPAPQVAPPSPAQPASPAPTRPAGPPAHQARYTTADLVVGLPDPRHDLVTVSMAIPRELAQALGLLASTTHRPRKDIVADALYAHLPPNLVREVRAALYPGAG